jgi:hypothetical protein
METEGVVMDINHRKNILHLISDGKMVHTINFTESSERNHIDIINRLKGEAEGYQNQIILCDENNQPVDILEFTVKDTTEDTSKPKEKLLVWFMAAFVLGMYLYLY